ncbi:MAG: ribosome small subunit-dependent GTPase A [Gammaproteobacteria bacterium]|jgi:ribosome biogenesis GTPase|nr:ribosome small subunit-dependent GTPase A [Gammaproteobacteria bacterium]
MTSAKRRAAIPKGSAALPGTVVASYGQRGVVELATGRQARYLLKGRQLRAVCGDSVSCAPQTGSSELLLTAVLPRRNSLQRPNGRGRTEVLAANIDRVVVVTAAEPAADYFLVDRFLCAAELMGAAGVIVVNKVDLRIPADTELSEYATLGYPVVHASALAASGMRELEATLRTGTSILVGQSGVGKSSLVNKLVPAAAVLTSELSAGTGEGRHTTTASHMHTLAGGGRLIDSPGVREYAPVIDEAARVQNGFREILRLADTCRFANCQHTREPNCAVKDAVTSGLISARRYASYKRLRNMQAAAGPH